MYPVILVLASSGGLGASTLAAALAARVSADGLAVLVDGDLDGGGIDATVAVEHQPGLRWGDLCAVEGGVDGGRLIEALPCAGDLVVLSAGGGERPGPSVIVDVVRALAERGVIVIDGARGAVEPWRGLAHHLVIVAGTRPRQVRDAQRLLAALGPARDTAMVVTRGSRRSRDLGEAVAAHLGIAWIEHLRDDPTVPRDEARGRSPGARGSLGEVVEATIDAVGVVPPGRRDAGHGGRAS